MFKKSVYHRKISVITSTEICHRFQIKHCIYSLLTHKLIAISGFIAVQTGTLSKCKIFSRYTKIDSPHCFKSQKVSQHQFVVSVKNFPWQTFIQIPPRNVYCLQSLWSLCYPLTYFWGQSLPVTVYLKTSCLKLVCHPNTSIRIIKSISSSIYLLSYSYL